MRKMLLPVVGLLALPAVVSAQVIFCNDCEMGLWDEPEMIHNFGAVSAGTPKDIYLGVKLGAGETGVTTIEFSISNMRQVEDNILVVGTEGLTDPQPNIFLGSVQAPADTSSGTAGTGGSNIAWPSCVTSTSQALIKITFLSFAPVSNKVFVIKHRYPPTNTFYPYPLFTRCDPPEYTKVAVPGGCYIAGWDGTTNPVNLCAAKIGAVENETWTGMKQLYR